MLAKSVNLRFVFRRICAVTFLLCAFPVPSFAQTVKQQQKEQAEYVSKLCKTSVSSALQKVRRYLDDYPDLQKKTDLVVIAPNIEFNAYALYTQQRIVLTSNICVQLFLMSRAMLMTYKYELPTAPLLKYINYLGDKTTTIERNAAPDEYIEFEILPFELHAKLDIQKLTDKDKFIFQRVIEDEMPNFILAIIGHELGHLAKQHKPYNAISPRTARKQESAADAFAYELVAKVIGSRPDPTLFSMPYLLLAAREKAGTSIGEVMHPSGECRMVRLMDQSRILDTLANDIRRSKDYQQKTGLTVSESRKAVTAGLAACAE